MCNAQRLASLRLYPETLQAPPPLSFSHGLRSHLKGIWHCLRPTFLCKDGLFSVLTTSAACLSTPMTPPLLLFPLLDLVTQLQTICLSAREQGALCVTSTISPAWPANPQACISGASPFPCPGMGKIAIFPQSLARP